MSAGIHPIPIGTGSAATSSLHAKLGLGDVLADVGTKSLKYCYNFGDGLGTIRSTRLRSSACSTRTWHPLSAVDRGQGPLPVRGRRWSLGYDEFLEAIADPSHEPHRELKEWFADDFNG
jgi:Plasmid pRiA4b ORF-3-like protein